MRRSLLYLSFLLLTCGLSVYAQNGLHFNAGNDIVQTTFPGVQGTTNRTFEAWVFVDPSAPNSNLCIIDYGLNMVGSRNSFSVSGSRGLTFISGGTNANISSPGGTVPVGQWVHVAFVLDNGTGFLFVNGAQVGTGNLSTVNTPSGGSDLRIGQRVPGGSIPFQGVIDEVKVWNFARTGSQMAADTVSEYCGLPSGLLAYYKFNHGVAGGSNAGVTTLVDEVSGNDGTLNGFDLSGNVSNWVTGKNLLSPTPISVTDTVESCETYVSPSGNYVWDSTGVYNDTIQNPSGCDSLFTIDLTILEPSSGTVSLSGCDSVVSPSGNYVYYSTGIYQDTILNAAGCDSVMTVDVTIPVIDDSVSVNGNDLTAIQGGAIYQWFDCTSGYTPIAGANSQTYTITSSGFYSVSIELSGCVDTSDCRLEFFTAVGLQDQELSLIKVYPNPSKGEFSIEGGFEGSLSVIDSKGNRVFKVNMAGGSDELISLPESIQNGVYFMLLENEFGSVKKKLVILRD